MFGIVWLELLLLVAIGVGAGFGLGYGAAEFLAGLFTAQSGVRLPVEFTKADAVLAASIFHFGTHTIAEAKQYMADRGVPVRIVPQRDSAGAGRD